MISWPADVTAERCPGRVRRQIGVETEVIDGRIVYSARLRDRWENPDTGESEDIHGWDLRLQTRPPDLTIVAAEAIPAALPFPECPAAALAACQLIGAKLTSGFPEQAKAAFKGVADCTHLLTLATAIWSQQVVSIYLYGRDEDPASREGTSTPEPSTSAADGDPAERPSISSAPSSRFPGLGSTPSGRQGDRPKRWRAKRHVTPAQWNPPPRLIWHHLGGLQGRGRAVHLAGGRTVRR